MGEDQNLDGPVNQELNFLLALFLMLRDQGSTCIMED